ncbi:MAG: Na+/H+ antiporter [Blastocatellia bacterium]|nr:Na+/H+ antiporter [Blastocatellia bacterium]
MQETLFAFAQAADTLAQAAEDQAHDTHFAITIFIILLLIASGVAMATKWIKVPYTLALVIIGGIISPMHFIPAVHISPELILLIFLPALLFEAAWNLKLDHLRENLLPILTLATLGVCLSVGVIGWILHAGIGIPWSMALLFGAMISATDPVSVLALFKKLGAPKRLTTIVEGESLFNDGTAVVVFNIILGIVIGTTAGSAGAIALSSVRQFAVVVFGGLAVGAIVGILASILTSYFDDHLLEIMLTTTAAYGSFLLAEELLHVSPVIAVLVAGLIIGNQGRARGMSPTTQVAVSSFWEYAAFVVNSLVFLLIGLEVQVPMLVENATPIFWAVMAMLAARVVAIYGLVPVANRFALPVPFRWQHVLFWGGLRGSLSIALVLSLKANTPGRSQLVALIFGTVIFSLLVQGLTISPLLRWLRITQKKTESTPFELLQGEMLAESAALAELDTLSKRGMITERVYKGLKSGLSEDYQELSKRMARLDAENEEVEQEQQRRIHRHLIDVRKARLGEILREGVISEAAYHQLNEQLNDRIAQLEGNSTETETESEAEAER